MNYSKLIWVCALISGALLVGGFFCPPLGVIDSSVIMAVGEIGLFATLAVICKAIDNGYDAKMSKGDKTLELKN